MSRYSDSDTDTSEDDEAELLTDNVLTQIAQTVAAIRNKDPAVYDKERKFFSSDDEAADEPAKKKKEKPLLLDEYKLQYILQRDGNVAGDSEDEDAAPRIVTHAQEQEEIRKSFIRAAADVKEESDDENILKVKQKAVLPKKSKHQGPTDILERFLGDESTLDETDKFLRDYILDKKWEGSKLKKEEKLIEQDDEIDKVDDEHEDKAEEFETTYNFRFEEQGGSNIIGHPRAIPGTVRTKAQKRKESREKKKYYEDLQKTKDDEEMKRKVAAERAEREKELGGKELSLEEQKKIWLEEFLAGCAPDADSDGEEVPFGYKEVEANSYGLSMRDLLAAEDEELDTYVPVKKLAPYREKEWEPKYINKPKPQWMKKQEEKAKEKEDKLHPRDENDEEETKEEVAKEAKAKRKRRKSKQAAEALATVAE